MKESEKEEYLCLGVGMSVTEWKPTPYSQKKQGLIGLKLDVNVGQCIDLCLC